CGSCAASPSPTCARWPRPCSPAVRAEVLERGPGAPDDEREHPPGTPLLPDPRRGVRTRPEIRPVTISAAASEGERTAWRDEYLRWAGRGAGRARRRDRVSDPPPPPPAGAAAGSRPIDRRPRTGRGSPAR